MANQQLLPGYSAPSLSGKICLVLDVPGPANYQAVANNGANGGQIIKANGSGINMGGFDYVSADMQTWNNSSSVGAYYVLPVLPSVSQNGTASNNVTLRWFTNNAVEVANNTNLSLEYVRLFIIGE